MLVDAGLFKSIPLMRDKRNAFVNARSWLCVVVVPGVGVGAATHVTLRSLAFTLLVFSNGKSVLGPNGALTV
jgi:hypothetical protein